MVKRVVNDSTLDVFDGDWRFIDAQNTGTLTRSGANTTSKLREIVGLCQLKSIVVRAFLNKN